MQRDNFCIFINTTDTFEDCWHPFFKLFQRFWLEYKGKIYLNTEYKRFECDGLDIICVRNSEGIDKKLSWSECLIKALNKIDSDNILYMQEDYFLNDYVNNELINDLYKKFMELNCDCLHLTDQSTPGPFKPTSDKMIWEIAREAPYRISCQAAFWKKEVLLSYLRKHESAWQFEHYGTKRSRRRNDKFCVINSDLFGCGKKEIVPYIFTGIIKGKWNREAADLFERYSIRIDYERRGFCNADIQKTLLGKIKNRLNNKYIKTTLLSNSDLFLLKLKKSLDGLFSMETEKVISNWDKLKYRVPLILEGFNPLYNESKPVSPESHVQLQLNVNSYQQNYEIFKNRALNSIGKTFLPIYRMADGEFHFVREISKLNSMNKILYKMGIKKIKTCWGEKYAFNELFEIKKKYFKQLKRISEKGLLALHFVNFSNSNHPYSGLYKLVTDIFDQGKIYISENNYTSFYYVYALLTGPDRTLVLKDNKILIITSYNEQKKAGIEKFLEHEKASSVNFLKISPYKSMFEKIDLSNTDGTYDLVLIGAGIGSSNILAQCEKLNTVCIDAGIVLERYANPELSRSRIFIP